jgi:tetratricopeptide (TPR) repeat protein
MRDRDHFARVDDLFRQVLRLTGEERDRFLDERCGDDAELRQEMAALLHADGGTTGPLDQPPSFASSLIADARANPGVEVELPRRIGGYRIIQRIGTGGMGTVFEAEQENPRRMVALKVISPGLVSRSMFRRFQFETEVLGRLQHPGIAQIYAAGTFDAGAGEQPYFAMELVDGTPLMQYAGEHELSMRKRLELLALLCDAVQHAHHRGVIHRDLKPANVLVTSSGQPKILDFGVARATDSDVQVTTLQTNIGQIVGTVPYMSPEQAAGDAHAVDTRSDVYSLGVLGYELLTGRLPYDVRDKLLHEALRSIREDVPTPLSTRSRLLAGDVATIIGKALEKENDRRYQSAAALADDIRRFLRNEAISARPPSRVYQLRVFARRHKPLVAAGAIAAAALVVATIVSIVFALSEAQQRTRAERRFEDVRSLANTFLFDVDAQLETLGGATPVRETIVSTALTYLDRLAEDVVDDPTLLDELADAYVRVGDIQGNPRLSNLGDTPSALASYRKSLGIRQTLAALSSNDVSQLRRLAALHERIGTLQSYLSEPLEALVEYSRALEMTQSLLAMAPDELDTQRDLAKYHGMIGDIQRQMGRFEDALQSFQRELNGARAVAKRDPDQGRAQRAVSVACNDVGSVLSTLDRDDEALQHFEEGLAIRETLAAAAPEDVRAKRDLAISLNRLGNTHCAAKRFGEALELYRRSFANMETIATSDPSNVRAQGDLAVQHEKLGLALTGLNRADEALEEYQRGAAIWRRLSAADPDNTHAGSGVAVALDRCGDALRALGRIEDAIGSFNQSVSVVSAIIDVDPHHALAQTVLCMVTYKLGEVYEELSAEADPDSPEQRRHRNEAARWYARSAEVRDAAADLQVQLQAQPEKLDEAMQRLGLAATLDSTAAADNARPGS